MKKPVVAFTGGVGGAKLALGLSNILSPDELTIVVNTGDDANFFGLHVSPDIDIVMYTLAGLVNLHMTDQLMDRIAGMFPRCTFICHASTWGAENLAKYDNIFFEVVQYPDGTGSEWDFNWLADKVGRERLIFGADLPYYDYRILQKIIEEKSFIKKEDFSSFRVFKRVTVMAIDSRARTAWSVFGRR